MVEEEGKRKKGLRKDRVMAKGGGGPEEELYVVASKAEDEQYHVRHCRSTVRRIKERVSG